jgi:hypothetical protein
MRRSEQLVQSVLAKLKKHGKGIVLMHDFQRVTAESMPELLNQLKANGYKIVHMKPKSSVTSLAQYEELLRKSAKLPTVSDRPTSAVVRDVD